MCDVTESKLPSAQSVKSDQDSQLPLMPLLYCQNCNDTIIRTTQRRKMDLAIEGCLSGDKHTDLHVGNIII